MSNKDLLNIDILYEDANYAVVNKPSGLMVHEDGRSKGPFLTDWVLKKFPKAKNVGEPMRTPEGVEMLRPGIVHRLDRETSGALVVCKTQEGHAHLKQQFKDRTVSKKYVAFVWGEMEEEFGTINRPIGRSSGDFRKWSAQRGARGEMREAETYWTKLAGGFVPNELGKDDKFTYIEAEPKTGRTHQIRVHFSAIQHPVVGDVLYAPNRGKGLGFERTALHSHFVEFDTMEGKRIKVMAPLPEDFSAALEKLGVKL